MSRSQILGAAILASALLAVAGCGPRLTPQEQIELVRSQYSAELKSLTVKQDPLAAPAQEDVAGEVADPSVATGEAAEETSETTTTLASAQSDAEGEAAQATAPGSAVRTDVLLDILVSTTSQEYLPGITLDVEHVDAERREKDRRTLWVDTSGLVRGGGTQVTHVMENVDWESGDGFYVEVRTPIPEAERAQYREFSQQ